jgi:hypothetical protein
LGLKGIEYFSKKLIPEVVEEQLPVKKTRKTTKKKI